MWNNKIVQNREGYAGQLDQFANVIKYTTRELDAGIFEDERLTSDTAEENLRNKKIDFKKNKGLVDIESACIILEQYLNRKR